MRMIREHAAKLACDWCHLIGNGKATVEIVGEKQAYTFVLPAVELVDLGRQLEKAMAEREKKME